MEAFTYEPTADRLLRAVHISLDHEGERLRVGGDGLPRVEIRRNAGTPPERHVPIVTRDSERLALSVGGVPETLRPTKGFLTRCSYRVQVEVRATGRWWLPVLDPPGHQPTAAGRPSPRPPHVDRERNGEYRVGAGGGRRAPGAMRRRHRVRARHPLRDGAEPMWDLTLNALLEMWP